MIEKSKNYEMAGGPRSWKVNLVADHIFSCTEKVCCVSCVWFSKWKENCSGTKELPVAKKWQAKQSPVWPLEMSDEKVFSVFLKLESLKNDSPSWLCNWEENNATKRYIPAKNTEMKFLKVLFLLFNIATKVELFSILYMMLNQNYFSSSKYNL